MLKFPSIDHWFLNFLPSFNDTSFIKRNAVDPVQSLYLGACLTAVGGVWRDCVYATPIQNLEGLNLKIVHLEILNIVIALMIWGSLWSHSTITVHCDNLGIVFEVKTGIRNIWF